MPLLASTLSIGLAIGFACVMIAAIADRWCLLFLQSGSAKIAWRSLPGALIHLPESVFQGFPALTYSLSHTFLNRFVDRLFEWRYKRKINARVEKEIAHATRARILRHYARVFERKAIAIRAQTTRMIHESLVPTPPAKRKSSGRRRPSRSAPRRHRQLSPEASTPPSTPSSAQPPGSSADNHSEST